MKASFTKSKVALFSASFVLFGFFSSSTWAASSVLKPDDFVGISFWLISMALVASTAFSFWNVIEYQRNGKLPSQFLDW